MKAIVAVACIVVALVASACGGEAEAEACNDGGCHDSLEIALVPAGGADVQAGSYTIEVGVGASAVRCELTVPGPAQADCTGAGAVSAIVTLRDHEPDRQYIEVLVLDALQNTLVSVMHDGSSSLHAIAPTYENPPEAEQQCTPCRTAAVEIALR